MHCIKVGRLTIGEESPCFIIAEAGVNHNGDVAVARRLVEAAKEAGAGAVKFQTFTTESVIIAQAPKADYQRQTTDASESQLEMLRKLQLSHRDFRGLKEEADRVGILFFSTPHDTRDIDFLVSVGAPLIKVPSMDIVNLPLLEEVGRRKVPVVLSTGMATLSETERALATLRQAGCPSIILLHCVTNYPIKDEEANLRVMDTLARAFDCIVGFSDHTVGTAIAVAAVARGAKVIEKHFTLDCAMAGPDHAASLDPSQFAQMVTDIRRVEQALGSEVKRPLPVELANRKAMRRSLVADADLPAGTVLAREHVTLKRPGTGLGAELLPYLLGRTVKRMVPRDSLITLDMLFE
ncbi:MAG: N-acetylneuraminate synthase [Nitrospirae bacterium]|nr:MAG: N-acetylneuraminate synthase [Nitrospirota bacterium]